MKLPHCRTRGHARLALVLAGFVVGSSHGLHAQSPPSQQAAAETRDTLSAVMLRRVAAAVDGYRIGGTVWVVMSFTLPYPVDTVVADHNVAIRRQSALGDDYHVLGPYSSPANYRLGPQTRMLPFCHDWDSDWCNITYTREETTDLAGMDSIGVVGWEGGTEVPLLTTRSPDAIFLTMAAADKFYFPYLASVYGLAYADSVRKSKLPH